MVFFWACEVTETKAAVVQVPESFVLNVCNATLATATSSDQVLSVGVETQLMEKKQWKGVVCHLGGSTSVHQYKLDLVFGAGGSQVKFYLAKGTGKVNLSGYFQPGPPADLLDDDMMQLEVVPNELKQEKTEQQPKKKSTEQAKVSKKRAREESAAAKQTQVTWDQTPSDDESGDEEGQEEEEEEVQKTPTKKPQNSNNTTPNAKPKKANDQVLTTPPASASTPQTQTPGSAKKKNKKRRKKSKGANKVDN